MLNTTDKWLSVTEASVFLGKSPSGVRALIRERRLNARQDVPGGKYVMRLSECERYLAEIESAPVPSAA